MNFLTSINERNGINAYYLSLHSNIFYLNAVRVTNLVSAVKGQLFIEMKKEVFRTTKNMELGEGISVGELVFKADIDPSLPLIVPVKTRNSRITAKITSWHKEASYQIRIMKGFPWAKNKTKEIFLAKNIPCAIVSLNKLANPHFPFITFLFKNKRGIVSRRQTFAFNDKANQSFPNRKINQHNLMINSNRAKFNFSAKRVLHHANPSLPWRKNRIIIAHAIFQRIKREVANDSRLHSSLTMATQLVEEYLGKEFACCQHTVTPQNNVIIYFRRGNEKFSVKTNKYTINQINNLLTEFNYFA